MLIAHEPARRLGVATHRAVLRFAEHPKPTGTWAGRRVLEVAGTELFELSRSPPGVHHLLPHWGLTHFLLDGHHKLQAAAIRARHRQPR